MSGVLLANDQHFLACFPGKNAPFASKRVKNPILACGCRKSAKFSARFSSFTANNVKSVGTLSLDRIVSGKVNALAKEGSDDGGGVSVVENDSQSRPSFFDEYVKAMESVISYRERKGSDDEDRNSSKRVLSEGVGEDDGSSSRDDAQSENGGYYLPQNGAIRKGKFERKETRAYEKEKGGTGRKEEQKFGRSLNGLDADKDASIKVLVHEARKDNHKVGWGDKLAQNSVWKGKDKPENKENRVDREAKWVSKDESIRKERQVLRKDFNGHDAVVDFQQTFAAKDEPFRKEKHISGKDFNDRDAVMDRLRTSAAKDESVRKERQVLGKDFNGRDAVMDHQRRSSAKDESFRKERLVLVKDFYGRDAVVDHQRTSAPNNESVRKERHALGKDFKGRDAVIDHQQRSAAKDESFRKERQVLGKDFNGRDAVVDRQRTSATNYESVRKERQVLGKDFYGCNAVVVHQQTSVANVHGSKDRSSGEGKPYVGRRSSEQDRHVDSQRVATYRYGNEKSNVKLLGSGVREGKVTVNGYASEQGFRNKKKAWQLEDDGAGFKMDRAAFRTSEVPGEVVDKPKTSRMEMEERIRKLANRLNGADIEIPEWMFSQMMRSAKIKFCDHSIMRVIQILGKLGNWRRVLQVIEWLQERERHKSHRLRYIYTAALDALGKARRPVEALNLFQTMQNKMSTYPDLVAYHSIAVTLGQAGHMRELFDVIDVMRSPPKKIKTSKLLKWDPILEPDLVVYDAVLNACVKRKQWEGAFWVLQQLKQSGQEPSSTTYGLIMEVMFACEKYNLVHELFRKVQKSGIPSALIYKVLVNTLWREGKTDEAVLAVQEMERRGIVGPAALYYDLARCLCSVGRCQEALMLMEKICKVANKPLVVTYTGLIQTCLDSGEIQNATFIFKEMEKFCSPNLVTCNIMINAYIKHRMYEEAKDLFNKMLEDRDHIISKADYKTCVLPDTYTFNTMLDACFEGKMWDDLDFIFQKMLDHGYHFNAGRHLRFVLESSRAGKTGPLEATWNYFACGDQIPPPALLKEHFCRKLVERDYATALSSFFRSPGSNGPGFSQQAWSKLLKENIRRFCRDGIEGLVNEVEFRALPSSSEPNPELETLLISCKEVLGIGS